MQALILHRVKNGFLVAIHAGEKFIDLSEAFVAHSAAELVEHIESHFSKPAPAQPQSVMVPADAVLASLNAAKDSLAEPPELTEKVPTAPAAQVQA